MKKSSKRLFFLFMTFVMTVTFTYLPAFSDLTYGLESDTEAVITAADVEDIINTAPKYLNYYSHDSADTLKNILDIVNSDNLYECSEAELKDYYNSLTSALKDLTYKTAEVPQVYISTANGNGNSIEKENGYVDTGIAVVDTDGTVISDDAGYIKVRGNSTSTAEKKPFKIKFSEKKNILNMGKAKKWVLLANCLEPTLLRNYIAFDFARYMGLEYTSQQRIVELWVDGVFKGCYLLTEPVEAGRNRVDIDTDGNDFLIEYEYVRTDEGRKYFYSGKTYRFGIKAPEDPTEDQIADIKAVMDGIVRNIDEKNYDEIKKLIDIKSFVNYYILNEYFKNVDIGNSSVFFYYKNGILYAGPPWDYDLSAGNVNAELNAVSYYKECSKTDGIFAAQFQLYRNLCECEEFQQEVKKAYENYQGYIRNLFADNGLIDSLIEENRRVIDSNFSSAGWKVSRIYSIFMRYPDKTYEENADFLKSWLSERYEWLCGYWGTDMRYDISLNFRDKKFIDYLSAQFDSDGDGFFSESEIEQIREINVSNMGISDLTGIEYLKNLETLDCSGNDLSKLCIEKNKVLKKLNCSDNKIRYLDISGNTALTSLNCSNNCLSFIDPDNCSELTSDNFLCNNNVFCLKCNEHKSSYKLGSIKGFVPSRAVNFTGSKYNTKSGNVYALAARTTYMYSTRLGKVQFVIKAEKHEYGEMLLESEADCVNDRVHVRICNKCGDKKIIVESNTAYGHKMIQRDPALPDCTHRGNKVYWECENCKGVFSDPDGNNKLYKPEPVSALGHDWKYYLSGDGIITAVCQRDRSHTASLRVSAEDAVYDGSPHELIIDRSDWTETGLCEPLIVYDGDTAKCGTVNAAVTVGQGENAVSVNASYVISYVYDSDHILGDVTGNGKVNIHDAIEIARSIVGTRKLTYEETLIADFNGDGKVNIYDAIAIAASLLKKPPPEDPKAALCT